MRKSLFSVVVVVFDLSSLDSLASCKQWAEEACSSANDPHLFLVGAKRDLLVRKAVWFFDVSLSIRGLSIEAFCCSQIQCFKTFALQRTMLPLRLVLSSG